MTSTLFDLLGRIAQKDEMALLELRSLTERQLTGSVLRVVKNPWTADEIVQDVYTYVWMHAAEYNTNRSHPAGWLLMLCRSRALDSYRRSQREVMVGEFDERFPAIADRPSDGADAFWRRDTLREGFRQLRPQQRRFITMAFFEGFTHSEIADRTGLPLGTVKTRIRGALHQLKESLPALT
jgi:RNA polymerase sigma-70 factor, ECF subfamily